MCLHLQLVAAESACAGPEHQVEDVFGVDCQSAELGAVHFGGPGYGARLAAISVQSQASELGRGDVYRVPLEDDRGLGGIAAAQDGRGGLALAKGAEDVGLERMKLGGLVRLFFGVSGDFNVHNAPGGDVGREEDGGEFDLRAGELRPRTRVRLRREGQAIGRAARTRRLSSVRSTATPASTLPTVRETSMADGRVWECCHGVGYVLTHAKHSSSRTCVWRHWTGRRASPRDVLAPGSPSLHP